MEWINVKEKLPESGQVVLTFDSRMPDVVFLNTFVNTSERGNHWIDREGYIVYSIRWWMPLPEPPKCS